MARVEVARAVCASVSRIEGSVMQELLDIRNKLLERRAHSGARYAVLHTSGWWVLWIEGTDEAVEAALQRTAADPRNEHQKLLHRSRGIAHLRERVMVASTQTPLRPTQYARWVLHMMDDGRDLEPIEIWNRLGAPCVIDKSAKPSRPVQQFAFIAADDHGPVDVLKKLSEHFRSPVVYQRFGVAQMHSPDLGSAYVDVPVKSGAARVRVMSGKAMARSAVRESMPKLDALILLIDGRPTVVVELATNVAKAIVPLEVKPKVWLAGAGADEKAACIRLLALFGIHAKASPLSGSGPNDLFGLLAGAGLSPITRR